MGIQCCKNREYVTAGNLGDPLQSNPKYFSLNILITIEETYMDFWNDKKKIWYTYPRKMIIKVLDYQRVCVLSLDSSSLSFEFKIDFPKDSFPFLQDIPLIINYNNYITGYIGSITLTQLNQSIIKPCFDSSFVIKGTEQLKIKAQYCLIGPIIKDFLQTNLIGIDIEQQKKNLLQIFSFINSNDKYFITEDHKQVLLDFISTNNLEIIVDSILDKKNKEDFIILHDFLAKPYELWPSDIEIPKRINELIEMGQYNEKFFSSLLKILKYKEKDQLIYDENIMKCLLINCFNNKKKEIQDFIENNIQSFKEASNKIVIGEWFFENILTKCLENDEKAINYRELIAFLSKNYESINNYIFSFREKLNELNSLSPYNFDDKTNILYLTNIISENKLNLIQVKIIKTYGINTDFPEKLRTNHNNLENLINEKDYFSSFISEHSNISIICSSYNDEKLFISHIFLSAPIQSQSKIKSALFFITNNEPFHDDLKKYYNYKENNNDSLKEIELQPVCYIQLNNENYKEIQLDNIIEGKFFTMLALEAEREDKNMEIERFGCIGYYKELEKLEKIENAGLRVGLKIN